MTMADAETIAREIGNYDVARWLAGVPYPYSLPDARAFAAGAAPGKVWAIEDRDGFCGIVDTQGELGYWLARRVWGRGYLTEAGDAVIDAYFADRRNRELSGSHMEGNDRSRHVLTKLGFVPRGQIAVQSAVLGQHVSAQACVLTRARWQERRRYRLATPRLRLREMHDGDLAAVQRLAEQPGAIPSSFSAAPDWIDKAKYRGRAGFCAAICTRPGRLIGLIRIGRIDDGRVSRCAWAIDPAYRGRGLMAEAAGAFLADMMARFDLRAIDTHQCVASDAERALLHRLGFCRVVRAADAATGPLEPDRFVIYRLDRSNLKAHA